MRCTTKKYDRLYARWLKGGSDLLDFGALQTGERVLDLCGGTGVIASEALDRGASEAWLLDLNPRCPDERVIKMVGTAEAADITLEDAEPFDLIVCRQAIGYLELPFAFHAVKRLLAPRGKFVFNSFLEPRWRLHTYRYGGKRYVEASGYWRKHVFHLQASPTIGADVTHFRHHTKHEIITELLKADFGVKIEEKGRSIRFFCQHKEWAEYVRGLRKQAKTINFATP
jgi:ubiquinone/menaquinone biosynthesis C-methylase UbiE